MQLFHIAGSWLAYLLIIALCIGGIILSCLSISGTWLVLIATIIAALLHHFTLPGWLTIIVFIIVSILVELMEAFAGSWGVTKRGGSNLAGFMAFIGAMLGMIIGAFIPIPIFGSLFGMIAGSFLLVFLVEHKRLQSKKQAGSIATGAVIARIIVIIIKVLVTLLMSSILIAQLIWVSLS